MKRELGLFTPKEISVFLNNAVAAAMRPQSFAIQESRIRHDREFTEAMLKPLQDMVTGGVDENGKIFPPCLRAEELVAILVTAAMFVQMSMVLHADKLPQAGVVEMLFDKTKKTLI